jgi:glycosyltransferase involved in cell wall biosynthesis
MFRFRSRSARALPPAAFEAAPLDIWESAFPSIAAPLQLELPPLSAQQPESSEAQAAAFLLALLRENSALRRRFPRALSEGEHGRFGRWLQERGEKEMGLSPVALKKIRGALRRRPGQRVYHIYLNDPELQKLYPLGLLPLGQLHFLQWLARYGRRDQGLRDEEILWFLHESAEDQARGWCLTYLLQPPWQEHFPRALTPRGWREFRRWIGSSYGEHLKKTLPASVPPILSKADQRSLERSMQPGAGPLEGVNVMSHFCNPSGIQQAALWTKAALERAGLRTSCRDVPVARRVLPRDRAEWLGLELFPITILTHAATPYFLSGYERSGLFRREGVYRIAYWAWELETVPDEWVEVAQAVDEIWSPTEFVAQAMRARMPRPVYHMLPGVEVGSVEPVSRAALNIPADHFVFLFAFDLHSQIHRKNPLGLIRAFQTAFRADDAVTLVIKASGGDIHMDDLALLEEAARGENIVLVHELVSRARAYGFIAMADCFVSLHRSEGFGLGLAEAMLLGKPVIATGYSGNLAFMSRENSLLVDYEIVGIDEDRPLYTKGNFWADPSIEHAAACMRQVYEHGAEARERAARAQPGVQRLLCIETAGQRMRERLTRIQALR